MENIIHSFMAAPLGAAFLFVPCAFLAWGMSLLDAVLATLGVILTLGAVWLLCAIILAL